MKLKFSLLILPFLTLSGCFNSCKNKDASNEEEVIPVKYRVNEAEYKAALDFSWKNVTMTATQQGGDQVRGFVVKMIEDGSTYLEEYGYRNFISAYQHMEDDSYRYIVPDNDGDWFTAVYYTKDDYVGGAYVSDLPILIGLEDLLEARYSSLSFIKDLNSYHGVFTEDGDVYEITIKFEYKKLTTLDIVETTNVNQESEFSYSTHVAFTDYGRTEIDFEGFHIRDELYVVGRTFKIIGAADNGIFNGHPYEKEEFLDGNIDSTLTFTEEGEFLLSLDLDFDLTNPKDYSGTYVFQKFGETKITYTFTSGTEGTFDCAYGDAEGSGYDIFVNLEIEPVENKGCILYLAA